MNRPLYYRMVGADVIPVESLTAEIFSEETIYDRIVSLDFLPQTDAEGNALPERIKVSTVFLAIDHGHGDKPLLFETMIFGGVLDGTQERYATYWDAVYGHRSAVVRVLKALDENEGEAVK